MILFQQKKKIITKGVGHLGNFNKGHSYLEINVSREIRFALNELLCNILRKCIS